MILLCDWVLGLGPFQSNDRNDQAIRGATAGAALVTVPLAQMPLVTAPLVTVPSAQMPLVTLPPATMPLVAVPASNPWGCKVRPRIALIQQAHVKQLRHV